MAAHVSPFEEVRERADGRFAGGLRVRMRPLPIGTGAVMLLAAAGIVGQYRCRDHPGSSGAVSDAQQKPAALDRDIAAVEATDKQVNLLATEVTQARAVLAQKPAALRQAKLNEGYTTITVPLDGTVGDRTLRVGQYVQAGMRGVCA